MNSHPRTPEEIEREIEHERAGLTSALDDLQDKLSLDGIIRQVSTQFRDHGGEIGTALSKSIKQNPLALVVTGAGLAWLMMGNREAPTRSRFTDDRDGNREFARRAPDLPSQDRSSTRTHLSGSNSSWQLPGSLRANPYWARRSAPIVSGEHKSADDQDGMTDKAREAYGTVSGKASQAYDSASDQAGDMADTAKDLYHTASEKASDWADGLRARLAEGTEMLEHEARERVIAARHKAMMARDEALDRVRAGRDRASDMFDHQPLIAGAIALVVGAAIGAALPRTRTEDDAFGHQSDALMHEAEEIFAEEKAKLARVAKAAGAEAKSAAGDMQQTAVDAARSMASKARESGVRVADAARSEADTQELGNIDR